MQLNEITYEGQSPVEGYGPGFFRVSGQLHQGAILLSQQGLARWEGTAETASLLSLGSGADVVLIGTGSECVPLPADLKAELEANDVPYEIMATPSACRTYNVLLAEGRRVAAALLPV
ncbi:MAG: hypothetical protein GY952_02740 [Rhodobacteraceae bacterium]|nr:hypothetical protein [Paracoccaceae bacterium]